MNIMSVRKVTISVSEELLEQVDELAQKQGQSRSEWLAASAEQRIASLKLRKLINRGLARTGGPVTSEERRRACEELGLPYVANDVG